MTPIARPISPTSRETLMEALHISQNQGQIPQNADLTELAGRIMGITSAHIPHNGATASLDDPCEAFINQRVIAIPIQEGEISITLQGTPFESGFHKTVKRGILTTRTQIRNVAIVETNPKNTPNKTDWNGNELAFLNRIRDTPIPECAEIFLNYQLPTKFDKTQFISLQKLYNSDLFKIQNLIFTNKDIRKSPHINGLQEQVVKAIQALHKRKLIHRDIKPENILVNISNPKLPDASVEDLLKQFHEETKIEAYACDFAYVDPMDSERSQRIVGSPAYLCPERVHQFLRMVNEVEEMQITTFPADKADIWALGLTLLSLQNPKLFLTVSPCRESQKLKRVMTYYETYNQYFLDGRIAAFPEPETKTSKLHMIWRMLQPRPEMRPDIEEVAQIFCAPPKTAEDPSIRPIAIL